MLPEMRHQLRLLPARTQEDGAHQRCSSVGGIAMTTADPPVLQGISRRDLRHKACGTIRTPMGISQYIKEIGRGARGAKPLDRAQAFDLFGQVLDGTVTDL